MTRKIAVLGALALAAACLIATPTSGVASSGPLAAKAKTAKAKGCKKARRHCKHHPHKGKKAPNPYVEGQPCAPARAEAYARYGYLCIPQPQPNGTTAYELVKSLA